MSDSEHRQKVTLEDLLRLKKAERPTAEFWAGFERELRQKQLAALVARRPWWQNLPHLISRRAYLPIGATAVLAFTLVSVRYYSTEGDVRSEEPATPAAVRKAAPLESARVAANGSPTEAASSKEPAAPEIDDRTAVSANVALSEHLPEQAAQLTPWSAPARADTPSSQSIAATIATLEQTQPELANAVLGGRIPSGNHVQETVARTAEFATVSAVASRRGRLLVQFNDRHFAPEPQAPEVLRERLTRRMAYEDMNERFSRVDLQADRVAVKF